MRFLRIWIFRFEFVCNLTLEIMDVTSVIDLGHHIFRVPVGVII